MIPGIGDMLDFDMDNDIDRAMKRYLQYRALDSLGHQFFPSDRSQLEEENLDLQNRVLRQQLPMTDDIMDSADEAIPDGTLPILGGFLGRKAGLNKAKGFSFPKVDATMNNTSYNPWKGFKNVERSAKSGTRKLLTRGKF